MYDRDAANLDTLRACVVMALEYDRREARDESCFVNDVAGYWASLVGPTPLLNYTHQHLCWLFGRYGVARVDELVRAMGTAELAWRARFRPSPLDEVKAFAQRHPGDYC